MTVREAVPIPADIDNGGVSGPISLDDPFELEVWYVKDGVVCDMTVVLEVKHVVDVATSDKPKGH